MTKFKDFSRPLCVFSCTFQGKFNFQGLFKTILYIQVLFNKPVRTLVYCKENATGTVFHEHMVRDATKPVFRVSDKVRFKPAYLANGISLKLKIRISRFRYYYRTSQ